jgi:SEC-C motif-containing protein
LTTIIKNCFCGNQRTFEKCCQPIISGKINPQNAEQLMRSRFSAYVIEDYPYILQTYASQQRSGLSVRQLADSAQGTQWLNLQVLAHHPQPNTAQVEFKAFYQVDGRYYVVLELSDFKREDDRWCYTTGVIQKDSGEFSPERNSQCLCGSGKKFKKCCGT